MNQDYYNAITKMEEAGVDPEYIVGWEGGYVLNPPREEQRVTEAYEAGYEDGKEKNADNYQRSTKRARHAFGSVNVLGGTQIHTAGQQGFQGWVILLDM